jgi:acyl carrier protein
MSDILAKVQQAFAAAFGVEPDSIGPGTEPDDVQGWDSMGHVDLVAALEEACGLQFDIDDVMEMSDVDAIVRIVASNLGDG